MKSEKHMEKDAGNPRRDKLKLKRRIDELTQQLEAERRKSEDYLTRLKYIQADFENYEKRVKREREDIVKMSSEHIVTRMLVILDDLEMAVAEGRKLKSSEGVVKGLEMILTNLLDIFRQEGVAKIEAMGKAFDPSKHEAASFIDTDKVEENTVVRELRKGYLLNGKVIRASMVEVARKPVKTGDKRSSKVEIEV
ncbi:MAG: nucleotide exchange factor GrpE [Nitrososphaerales archaeon]